MELVSFVSLNITFRFASFRSIGYNKPFKELTRSLAGSKSIKVLSKDTGEDRTPHIKCLKGWCITIKAILSLWEKL